jgi:hypothetical protein
MFRFINNNLYFFLCQSADWQCVIQAEDEECAATMAIEKLMFEDENGKSTYKLSVATVVEKLKNNMIEDGGLYHDPVVFYTPLILANAGFHTEAANLEKVLETLAQELENE